MVQPDPARNAAIFAERRSGAKLREIGERRGITIERVRQIVLREGRRRAAEDRLAARLAGGRRIPDDTPLADLPLRTMARRALRRAGYETAGDVRAAEDEELLRIPSFAWRSLVSVRRLLAVQAAEREEPR